MSHFNLERQINQATKMDDKLQGPMPRWKRKALENSNLSMNSSMMNAASTSAVNQSSGGTGLGLSAQAAASASKNKSKMKTPLKNEGDRMLPNRRAMDFDKANYALSNKENGDEATEYGKALDQQMNLNLSNYRILAYRDSAPPSATASGPNRILYSVSKTQSAMKSHRYIPTKPDKVLDAPGILDDFYLNILDWSSQNTVGVALSNNLYLWNAQTGNIENLVELSAPGSYVSAMQFTQDGYYLAIGTSTNSIELWDIEAKRLLRTLNGHTNRVGSISWNNHVCSSGARSGVIMHSDVRVADHQKGSVHAHLEEISGLKWSPDGRYLASGGNDNQLHFWPASIGGRPRPVHTFTDHMAGIKAISWCPFQKNLVASGGGTADRTVRLWNLSSMSLVSTTDTKSQVSGLAWNEEYRELVSSHGYSNYEVNVWKYPNMTKIGELRGHAARIINMAQSPDGSSVITASADETLRVWPLFPFGKGGRRKSPSSASGASNLKDSKVLTQLHNLR